MNPLELLQTAWNFPVIAGTLKGGEAIATLTGAVGVYLAARNRVANFPWNIVSSLLFGVVFWQTGLISSGLLQVFGFVPLLGLGWRIWSRKEGSADAVGITRLGDGGWLVTCGFVVVFTGLWGLLMRQLNGVAEPYLDALVTGASIAGQYLQSRRILENWYVWIGVNAVYCGYLLPSQGLWFSTGLYAVFLGLAVFGLMQWQREMRQEFRTKAQKHKEREKET